MGSFYFLFPVLTDKTKDYLCIFAIAKLRKECNLLEMSVG